MARRAFTLVELLVVIGIIAVLIAIVVPALNRAREAAQATKCLSNEHQLSIVLVAYINDNNGWLPYQPNSGVTDFASATVYQSLNPDNWSWLADFIPYFNNNADTAAGVWVCPTALNFPHPQNPPNGPSCTNYLANAAVVRHRLSRITNPSSIVWLQEYRYTTDIGYLRPSFTAGSPPTYSQWCLPNGITVGQLYSALHNTTYFGNRDGGGNVAYLDGSAGYVPNDGLHASDFGLVGIPGQSNSNDPNTVSSATQYYGAFDN